MTQGATESFTYDKDQNLTEDGSFEYTYDAENRLVEVLPAEDDPNNLTADDKKLVFAYDYLNRRVRKLVYAWDPNEGDSGDWSATAELDLRFIYHERLLLLELDGLDSNAKVRKHVWGPGQSPKRERGASHGGPNSLLGTRDVAGSTNYVCFNNGTGSVAQLLDRSDGSVDAKYVYDTRGDTVRNTGTYAADNPLRYRAMYFDSEFDYVDTDCDGLYCAADADMYLPRLMSTVSAKWASLSNPASHLGYAIAIAEVGLRGHPRGSELFGNVGGIRLSGSVAGIPTQPYSDPTRLADIARCTLKDGIGNVSVRNLCTGCLPLDDDCPTESLIEQALRQMGHAACNNARCMGFCHPVSQYCEPFFEITVTGDGCPVGQKKCCVDAGFLCGLITGCECTEAPMAPDSPEDIPGFPEPPIYADRADCLEGDADPDPILP